MTNTIWKREPQTYGVSQGKTKGKRKPCESWGRESGERGI